MTTTSPELPSAPRGRLGNPIAALARVLDVTEGRAYTLVIGLVVASLLAVFGVPSTLGHVTRAVAPARPPGPAVAVAAAKPAAPAAPAAPPAKVVPATPLTSTPSVSFGTSSFADSSVSSPSTTSDSFDTVSTAPLVAFGTTSLFSAVGAPGAPEGVVVAKDGTVYVGTNNGTKRGQAGDSHVLSYTADGKQVHDVAITGQPAGHAEGLSGLALDPAGALVVADLATTPPRLLRVDPPTGTQTKIAEVPDAPSCVLSLNASPCEPLAVDHTPRPTALAYDSAGDLYVTDPAQATIWRLAAGAPTMRPFYQSNDLATADGPAGLAIDPAGNLLFTAGATLDPASPAGGALYKLVVNADGTYGARTAVLAFANGEAPYGVTLGPAGTTVVALRGASAIAVIGLDGTATRVVNPNNGPVPFDAPTGLALVGNSVLVANQSAANDPTHWALLSVVVAK